MVLSLMLPASVVNFQHSSLVLNFLGHVLPSACGPEVGLGEGLGKSLDPIYRWWLPVPVLILWAV